MQLAESGPMAAFVLLIVLVPKLAFAQLSVDKLELFLRPSAEAVRTGFIRISNDSDQAVQAVLDVRDWNRDDTGGHQFYKLGSTEGSCGVNVKVLPTSIRIEPNRTEPVRITFDGDAAKSCWAIVFIQAKEPRRASGRQSQIGYVIRTGVKVYVQPDDAKRKGEVDYFGIVQVNASATDSTKVPGIEVVFRNTGKAHLKPKGVIEVRNANNQVAASLDISEFSIAPGDARRVRLALPRVQAGSYVALALLDYGGSELAAGQLQFELR